MNKQQQIAKWNAIIGHFKQPVRGIPFPTIIKSLSGFLVEPIVPAAPNDAALIDALTKAAAEVRQLVNANPIRRSRPNEVGNDIEPFVIEAAQNVGLKAERPKSVSGRGQQTGYPDILIWDQGNRPCYLECKVFGDGKPLTTMRSFYLSPSQNFKVSHDARHLLIAFEVSRQPIAGSRASFYRPVSFKLIDLNALECDIKLEINSHNKRLYDPAMILTSGKL